jgi:hypothetical protein
VAAEHRLHDGGVTRVDGQAGGGGTFWLPAPPFARSAVSAIEAALTMDGGVEVRQALDLLARPVRIQLPALGPAR